MSSQAEWKARRSICKTLLYVELLFLLLVLFFSGTAESSFTRRKRPRRTILFKQGETSVPFEEDNGTITERVVHSFRIPSLVEVNGVLVAIADARYISGDDQSFIETVVKYSADGGKTWETQIAFKNSRVNVNRSRVMDPTVIVKGNKIFVIVAGFYKSPLNWVQQRDGSDWDTLLAIGEVNKQTINGKPNVTITWTEPISLRPILPKWVDGVRTKQFIGGVGPSIVTSNETLLFPVQVSNMDKRVAASLIYSVDNGATWAFSEGFTPFDCTESAIVEWEGKLILNSRRDNGYRRVFESSDMGTTWTEALSTLSQVWGNSPSRTGPGCEAGFVAATIEGKRVMLFTHPLNYQGEFNRDRLHLWMTDNQRIFDVGQISHGIEKTPYSSLLYTDDKLFCLHEIKTEDEIYSIVLARLVNELELMKSVLRSWKVQDEFLSGIHISDASVVPSQKGEFSSPFPTNGLVGFLSDRFSKPYWRDVYSCVDAFVVNGAKVHNGLRFGGIGGGARWPVGKQGQNQRYHFANYGFTLAATVTIDEVPNGAESVPLLGVSLDKSGSDILLGLSYTNNQQWSPIYGTTEISTGFWSTNKTYHVVLAMQNDVGSIYVDGEPLQGSGGLLMYNINSPSISHFYIGGYGNSTMETDSRVTVTNVLLYNRELSRDEIRTLYLGSEQITTVTV